MKKRAILIIIASSLLICAIAAQVYLKRPYLHDRMVEAIEHSLHAKASIASVDWRWLPAPAITITQLKAESDSFSLIIPKAYLIVSPTFFFSGSVALLRAKVIDPELVITKVTSASASPSKTLPFWSLRIKNGKLRVPRRTLTQETNLEPISLTGINGVLSSHNETGEFTISANSYFAQLLHLNGSFNFSDSTYKVNITAAEFESSHLLSQQATQSLLPKISKMTFSSHLEGKGPEQFTLQLTSNSTPFSVIGKNQSATVKDIDCSISRHNTNFIIDINTLTLNEPRLNLSGRISRHEKNDEKNSKPEWLIDLTGTEIDLAAARSAVLTTFPTNPIAQKVCDIVNGGSATTARYWFKGETSDFHHLQAMKIWAEAKDVPVFIPGIKLALDRASGPISIINGKLRGKNLNADIDKSHGENGTILLDLRHDHHDFNLELDLSADLKNLKKVLTQVVHFPKFQQELSRFTAIDGLAKGHLRLGDDLHHIETYVDVASMQATGKYNRLPSPFTVTAGSMTVAPKEVEWHSVQGSIGSQQINKTQGSVDWYDGIEINLDALDAELELKPLFEKGSLITNSATLSVRDFFQDKLSTLDGKATITNTSFSGRVGELEQWHLRTKFSASGLQLSGPQLPEVSSQNIDGEISQDQLRFAGIFSASAQELFLDGLYTHHWFKDWQGSLTVDGDIGQQLGEWIQKKQLMPTALFPNLPFRLEKFKVTAPGPLNASGTIISLVKGSAARVQLDIKRQPDQVIEKLTFIDGQHTGTLNYLSWPLQDKPSLLTWQGELDVRTFNDLFQQDILKDGFIEGSFTRLNKKTSAIYNGEILLNGVKFKPESLLPDLTLDTLHLYGDSSKLTIDQALATLGESQVQASGTLSEDHGKHTIDLKLTAPSLSSTSLRKTMESIKKVGNVSQRSSLRKSITGKISFAIDTFDYTRAIPAHEITPGDQNTHLLSITPFQGEITINPTTVDLNFDNSHVCGLSIQGSWHLDNEALDNKFSFSSERSPLYFEHALPCLGIKQSLIIGPFSINGEMSGRPDNWRHGTIALSSQEGLIKRMNLLSEIFTAVNFTDYFTWQDMPNMNAEGLAFNELTINAHIENNTLTLDKTTIKGKGVNLTGRGTVNLSDLNSDLTFFIAPFKMVDSIVTNIPLIGKALGGTKESILTFPVKVTGNIKNPEVTSLAPEAVGTAAWELFIDTLTLPYRIFQPSAK